jgi:5-(carboxyamino)imidazole ribonucleotide synthase
VTRDLSGCGGPRLGIVGGGQLAKMTALAALELGCEVSILERSPASPAAPLSSHYAVGDWNDPETLLRLAERVDVLTLENEFVDAAALAAVAARGHALYPTARSIGLVQDKLTQKQALRAAGLPLPDFAAAESPAEVVAAGEALGWPLVLKARRDGYDGKGNATIEGARDVAAAWARLGGGERDLYVEAFCPFVMELATILTVGQDGRVASYPVVESEQRDHICHLVRAPATVPPRVYRQAEDVAQRAVAAVGGTGSFGVEMFLAPDGRVLVNELAPRVHNSGHYSIEGCATSQFENHVRAVLGLPLGSTDLRASAAVMINLLGHSEGPGWPAGVPEALAVPGVHLHVYGKARSRPGRKMGHVTALGGDPGETEERARRAAAALVFGAIQ